VTENVVSVLRPLPLAYSLPESPPKPKVDVRLKVLVSLRWALPYLQVCGYILFFTFSQLLNVSPDDTLHIPTTGSLDRSASSGSQQDPSVALAVENSA
jgi:hypothetical protein